MDDRTTPRHSQNDLPFQAATPPRPQRDLSALGPHHTAPAAHGACAGAVTTAGGPLTFELAPAPRGVHVMRTHRRADGSKVHCSVLFDDLASFTDWLDADPMRFTHPLAFQQARRCFQQLLVPGEGDEPARP